MYQNQITTLHPPSRSDGKNIDLKSNLDSFYEEPEPLTDAEYDALDARSMYPLILHSFFPLKDLSLMSGQRTKKELTY